MHARTVAMALAAGVAVFLTVGASVTEFALGWIEFSLFVGFPVGLVAVAVGPLSVRASVALPASAAVALLAAVGTYAAGRGDASPATGSNGRD